MADGKYWVSYSSFLGYGRGFIIEEEGAYIVRLIYRAFLQGLSGHAIAKYLTEKGFHIFSYKKSTGSLPAIIR